MLYHKGIIYSIKSEKVQSDTASGIGLGLIFQPSLNKVEKNELHHIPNNQEGINKIFNLLTLSHKLHDQKPTSTNKQQLVCFTLRVLLFYYCSIIIIRLLLISVGDGQQLYTF